MVTKIDKILKKVRDRKNEVLVKTEEVKARISDTSRLDNRHCNTLIAQFLAAEIEEPRNRDIRYGQLLRNLGVIQEVRNEEGDILGWKNEYEVPSHEVLARLGDLADVRDKITNHVRRHSGLQRQAPKPTKPARYDYNKMINNLVLLASQKYPTWGFPKILRHLEVVKEDLFSDFKNRLWLNDFNTESYAILARVQNYEEFIRRKDEEDV